MKNRYTRVLGGAAQFSKIFRLGSHSRRRNIVDYPFHSAPRKRSPLALSAFIQTTDSFDSDSSTCVFLLPAYYCIFPPAPLLRPLSRRRLAGAGWGVEKEEGGRARVDLLQPIEETSKPFNNSPRGENKRAGRAQAKNARGGGGGISREKALRRGGGRGLQRMHCPGRFLKNPSKAPRQPSVICHVVDARQPISTRESLAQIPRLSPEYIALSLLSSWRYARIRVRCPVAVAGSALAGAWSGLFARGSRFSR